MMTGAEDEGERSKEEEEGEVGSGKKAIEKEKRGMSDCGDINR